MRSEYKKIIKDLERLATAKVKPDIFGADHHGYIMNPALPEATVNKFEDDHQIALPQEYRRLLIEAGNGGAGPYYGVFKLGEMDDGWGYSAWEENNGFVGSLSQPFPHTQAWNDLSGEPDADWQDEEAYERQLSNFEARYWNPEQVNGAIPICHLGCALRQWLVVIGPQAGTIWNDERTVNHVSKPKPLALLLSVLYPSLRNILPILNRRYVATEWIGQNNYLGEKMYRNK